MGILFKGWYVSMSRDRLMAARSFLTGKVEATDVKELSVLNEAPDLGLLQVVKVVVVGSTKVGAQAAVVASDDDAATTCLLLGVNTVLDAETSSLNGIVKNRRVLVVTGATEVDDAVWGEDVLGTTGGVLSGATGNELGVVVVEKVLVEGDVLLLSKDSIVSLEAVLVEKSLVADSLDVYCGTYQRDNCHIPRASRIGKMRARKDLYEPRRGFSRQRSLYSF